MKTFLILMLMVLVTAINFGQVNSNYDGPKPEIKKGSKSFVFRYTPFQSNLEPAYVSTVSVFDEENLDLFGIGFRYFFTDEIGVTGGLNFGTSSSSEEFTNGNKEDISSTSFGISADANYHFHALYSVSPYVGVNINFGSLSSTTEETEGGTTTKTEYYGNGFGVGVNFGFDWYFTAGLSLGGKYTLGLRSLGKPEEKIGNTTIEGQSSSFFGIGYASIILNVHI
jgi:hypothetical protein